MIFAVFLCPSTPFLYGIYIPVYVSKYIFLMYFTDVNLWTQFIKLSTIILIIVFFHYIVTIRELKRFYDYQKLSKREQALK